MSTASLSTFSVGKLIDLQWKLGIGMSSNLCSQLHAPFVTIFLKIQDEQLKMQQYSFELTISEFQAFARQFREISDVMDST